MQLRLGPSRSIIHKLPDNLVDGLLSAFTYENSSVKYQLFRHRSNKSNIVRRLLHTVALNEVEAVQMWRDELIRLERESTVSLLTPTTEGFIVFPTGLLNRVIKFFVDHGMSEEEIRRDSIVDMREKPAETSGFPVQGKPAELRPYQEEAVQKLLAACQGTYTAGTGCHPRGQKIMMVDGSVKNVEDIIVGEQLMGPDSKPRNVLKLIRGCGVIYKVVPRRGAAFFVNDDHILHLWSTFRDRHQTQRKKINISVKDYIKKSKKFKHLYKLVRSGIEFESVPVPIDPYFVGVLLGDGSLQRTIMVATADREINQYTRGIARSYGLGVRVDRRPQSNCDLLYLTGEDKIGANPIINALEELGLRVHCRDKFIPDVYVRNSRDVRLQLLAGLLDTDGCYSHGTFDFISLSEKLASDVVRLSLGLGFYASIKSTLKKCTTTGYIGRYYRVNISGALDEIPTKLPRKMAAARAIRKDCSVTGFGLERIGTGDYFGFLLDCDNLYLLDNFIITHNTGKTVVIQELIRRLGLKTVVIVPSLSIMKQTAIRFQKYFGNGAIGQFGGGKKLTAKLKKITIACAPSIAKSDPDLWSGVNVLIADESHHTPATTIETIFYKVVPRAFYRFGFTATNFRNDGADLAIEAAVFPPVCQYTVEDGIREGYLAKPKFLIYRVGFNSGRNYGGDLPVFAYKGHILRNDALTKKIIDQINTIVSAGKQVLVLVREKEHGYKIFKGVPDAVFVRDSATGEKEKHSCPELDPHEAVVAFNAGKIKCMIGTSIIGEGTDIIPVQVLINLMGGKSKLEVMQNIGRGLRTTDTKKSVLIIDYIHETNQMLEKHSLERVKIYKKIGEVDIQELKK